MVDQLAICNNIDEQICKTMTVPSRQPHRPASRPHRRAIAASQSAHTSDGPKSRRNNKDQTW